MDRYSDPWRWTTDEVVDQICRPNTLLELRPNRPLPDATILERIIRDNDIDGSTLLLHVDTDTLRQLGIIRLGDISAITYIVAILRRRSLEYQAFVAAGQRELDEYLHGAPDRTNTQDDGDNREESDSVSISDSQNQLKPSASTQVHHEQPERILAQGGNNLNSVKLSPSTARAFETYVEGENGQKRRRLDLQVFTPLEHGKSHNPVPIKQASSSHSTIAQGPRPRLEVLGLNSNDRFLCRKKLPVDSIFFGPKFADGKVNADVDAEIRPTDSGLKVIAPVEFFSYENTHCEGVQQYIYRQALHYFQSEIKPVSVKHKGKDAQAVFPYRSKLNSLSGSRSLILLDGSGPSVKAVQVEESDLDLVQDPEHRALEPEDFDLLHRWPKEDYNILPPYGGSDVEDDGYSSSLLDEIEADENDNQARRARQDLLTSDEVTDSISNSIKDYTNDWTERKLPLWQAAAWRLWKRAKNSHDRSRLASAAEAEARLLTKRLDKLVADISAHQWSKATELHRQCGSLEETIVAREELIFKARIWKQPEEPEHSATIPHIRKRRAPSVHGSDEEGIVLDSDSDHSLAGFSDFIVDDIKSATPPKHSRAKLTIGNIFTSDNVVEGRASETPPTGIEDAESSSGNVDDSEGRTEFPEYPSPAPKSDKVNASAHVEIVDLTQLPSTDSEQTSPISLSRTKSLVGATQTPQNPDDDPATASDEQVLSWEVVDLVSRQDRLRLLVSLIRTLPQQIYAMLRQYVEQNSEKKGIILKDHINLAIRCFAKHKAKIDRLPEEESASAMLTGTLFACFFDCTPNYLRKGGLGGAPASEILEQLNQKRKQDLIAFVKLIRQTFSKHTHPAVARNLGDSVLGSDVKGKPQPEEDLSEDSEPVQQTPRRKRKKAVAEDKVARGRRERARQNLQSQEERKRVTLQKMASGLMGTVDAIPVNPGKSDEHDFIYLNPHIGLRIHNHQIEGLQFLWREIVATYVNETDRQGALLSHTMGLGKTMQAISLLVTIAEAAASPEPKINSQIPDWLKESRTLIICPSSLVNNWMDEFSKWLPPNTAPLVGELSQIDSELHMQDRIRHINRWSENGGVLLISYDLFRNTINNRFNVPLAEEVHNKLKDQLTLGPRIVIADEAHKLKSPTSGVSVATSLFKTKSRIALTGSPLSNNLGEYYAMINWTAPGFLGDRTEFRANYEEPIRNGGFVDSSLPERRKAMRKLKVLEEVTEPKVHRRDVTVLRGTLPPKKEFVFYVPLTELQEQLYSAYVDALGSQDSEISQTRIFDWLHALSLICNHPMIFQKRLKDRTAKLEKEKTRVADQSTVSSLQIIYESKSDIVIKETPASPNIMTPQTPADSIDNPSEKDLDTADIDQSLRVFRAQEEILQKVQSTLRYKKHSIRTMLLHDILQQAEEAGDRVLVFSQSLWTLDFLEEMFTSWGKNYFRLDGSTRIPDRTTQVALFNQGQCDIFLISTKAGGLGFNLPAANRVIIFDFSFNPQAEQQAIGRAYRIGQGKPVYVYRFIAGGTFEEKLFNQAVFKTQLAFKVVEKKNTKNFAQRQMDYIFKPKKIPQKDLEEYRGKDRVLDRLLDNMEPDEGGLLPIRRIIAAETLQDPADEVLTAEDQEQIRQDIASERLRKENPAAYRQMLNRLQTQTPYASQHSPVNAGGQYPTANPQAFTSRPPANLLLATQNGMVWPTHRVLQDPSINSSQSFAPGSFPEHGGFVSPQPDINGHESVSLAFRSCPATSDAVQAKTCKHFANLFKQGKSATEDATPRTEVLRSAQQQNGLPRAENRDQPPASLHNNNISVETSDSQRPPKELSQLQMDSTPQIVREDDDAMDVDTPNADENRSMSEPAPAPSLAPQQVTSTTMDATTPSEPTVEFPATI